MSAARNGSNAGKLNESSRSGGPSPPARLVSDGGSSTITSEKVIGYGATTRPSCATWSPTWLLQLWRVASLLRVGIPLARAPMHRWAGDLIVPTQRAHVEMLACDMVAATIVGGACQLAAAGRGGR
jgi:hypothetical protein